MDDIPTSDLSNNQMLALRLFVEDLGRGLVFIGGKQAYSLGGYQGSILEPILPISMEPPPRKEHPPLTFVMVLDRFASMGNRFYPDKDVEFEPITLAIEAAMRVVETMQAEDTVGVLSFASDNYWDVPLQDVGEGLSLRKIQDAISSINGTGGTRLFDAMEEAHTVVSEFNPQTPVHFLILSDGQSNDGTLEGFETLANEIAGNEMTISTIALGDNADLELMPILADVGNGRFYVVRAPQDLPQVMLSESEAARGDKTQSGRTSLLIADDLHPTLSGLSTSDLPTLTEYNALTSRSKEGAEDVLLSANFEDPIFSVWQVGLGRVGAWMGDAGENWLESWKPESESLFWSQIIRYALPDPSFSGKRVEIIQDSADLDIRVHLRDANGIPMNLADVTYTYGLVGGEVNHSLLYQTQPGFYEIRIPLPEVGAYRGLVEYQLDDEQGQLNGPFSVTYPQEWQPHGSEDGWDTLDRWVEIGRGRRTELEGNGIVASIPQAPTGVKDFRVLLILLTVIWPIDILLRRRWLPWQTRG
jgi:hypothetical protein